MKTTSILWLAALTASSFASADGIDQLLQSSQTPVVTSERLSYAGKTYAIVIASGQEFPIDVASNTLPDLVAIKEMVRASNVAKAAEVFPAFSWSETEIGAIERLAHLSGQQAGLVSRILNDSGSGPAAPGLYAALKAAGVSDEPELMAALARAFETAPRLEQFRTDLMQVSTTGTEFVASLRALIDATSAYNRAASASMRTPLTLDAVAGFENSVPMVTEAARRAVDAGAQFWSAVDAIWPNSPRQMVISTGIEILDSLLRSATPVSSLRDAWKAHANTLDTARSHLTSSFTTKRSAGENSAQLAESVLVGRFDTAVSDAQALLAALNGIDHDLTQLGMGPGPTTLLSTRSQLNELIRDANLLLDSDPSKAVQMASRVQTVYGALKSVVAGEYLRALDVKFSELATAQGKDAAKRAADGMLRAKRLFSSGQPIEGLNAVMTIARALDAHEPVPVVDAGSGDALLERDDVQITVLPTPVHPDPFQNPWVLGVISAAMLLPLLLILFVLRRRRSQEDSPEPVAVPA